jgi:hypothetical protein
MTSLLVTKPIILSYGFIITRHVKCEKTNKYWNHCVRCIRNYYPFRKIIIIDDNSDEKFVKADFEYKNTTIVQSEFPGRGELLPYYYFYHNKYFDNAVIIHDSVFFHKKVNFDRYLSYPVMRLWHFNSDKENINNTLRIANYLNVSHNFQESLQMNQMNILGFNKDVWFGCFGLQCFIKHEFLKNIQNKYNIFNMLTAVHSRIDRCSTERIMGLIFSREFNKPFGTKSVFGDIMKYEKWGYSYDEYEKDFYIKKRLPKHIVKIWTGR